MTLKSRLTKLEAKAWRPKTEEELAVMSDVELSAYIAELGARGAISNPRLMAWLSAATDTELDAFISMGEAEAGVFLQELGAAL